MLCCGDCFTALLHLPCGMSGALLSQLQRERQMTVLAVTHHPQEWRDIADDLIFIDNGRVAKFGKAPAMLGPDAPDVVRKYLGDTKS